MLMITGFVPWVLAALAATAAAQSGAWGQCGGTGWTGSKTCVSGWTCVYINDYYSQCQQGANPGPTTTTGGNSPSPTQGAQASLCTQYAYLSVNGYDLLNNLWGMDQATGSQCTYYYGPSGSGISFGSIWSWQGDPNTVKTYIYAGRQFTRKKVSEILRLPTSVLWSYNTTDIRANVAYDIFTHPDPDHVNYNGEYELMIWLHRYGGIWPITSSSTGSPIATVNLAGHRWELYDGWNGDMRVYSFVTAEGAIHDFNGDVKQFFNHLQNNYNYPANNQYMLIYQFGTEAFTGGPANFMVNKFQADVY